MSEETKPKRAFYEDIFAEEADKWSWPGSGANAKASGSGVTYDTHTSEVKSNSSSSVNSDDGFVFRGDSNSLKRSFRKRGSSSASEGNQEEVSSSPHPSGGTTRERLLPSIYDDDAQSGSPSGVFEKKDLAFRSSFKKSFDSPSNRSHESSPLSSEVDGKPRKPSSGREHSVDKHLTLSPKRNDSRDARSKRSPSDRKIRSRSRSTSRDKKYRRRSRSRSRERRARSPQSKRRSQSRDRPSDRRRRYSRSRGSPSQESRRRSRSRSYDRRHRRNHYRSSSRDRHRRRRYSRSRSRSRDRSRGGAMTPQMALQQTMAAMSAKAQALTGIALPKYYNPAAVNPLKYAEQVQKRKLLWQTKEKVEEAAPKNSVWDKLTFAQDQDGRMTAKFRKLMGIKSDGTSSNEGDDKETALKKQEELFRDLDQQYEMARMTTHTQRGVGLGYSAQTLYPPIQK